MIIKGANGLNFEINKEDFTAKVINSPSTNECVFVPSFLNYESQKYFITTIGKDSFKNNKIIRSVEFSEDSKVDTIETDAFFGSSIRQLYIPPSLEHLKEGWCKNTFYLTMLSVSPNNKRFSLLDNNIIIGKSDSSSNNYDIIYFAPRNIRTVFIPSNIKYINSFAFSNCIYLSTINFASNSELEIIDKFAFLKASIESISIPDHVKIIQEGAFYKCTKLKVVDISEDSQLLSIEKDAFFYSHIERLFIPSKLESLKEGWCHNAQFLNTIIISEENDRFSLFDNMLFFKSDPSNDEFDAICYASHLIVNAFIPSNIKTIYSFTFSESQLQTIEFSEDCEIEVINKETFSESKITDVRFPKSVKILGEASFLNCKFLNKIEFPENSELHTIEDKAFYNSSIRSLNIPSKFVEFRGLWCGYTQFLVNISISPNNRRFDLIDGKIIIGKSETNDDDFDSIVFASRDIEKAVIPSKIKFIKQFAFNECNELEKVEIKRNSKLEIIECDAFSNSSINEIYIPRHVMRIGRRSFADCSLKTINFARKSQLQYIAKYAFSHSLIKSISIPDTVTIINDNAFEYCKLLETVHFSNESELSMIGKYSFQNTSISKIFIPKNVVKIQDGSFYCCSNLEMIELSEDSKLRCIGKNAFKEARSLKNLFIPSNLKTLKDGWCKKTDNLNEIKVSPKNKYFIDVDGQMVFGKSDLKSDNYDTLCFVARNIKDVIIPSFIKYIDFYAFCGCYQIFTLKVEENSQLKPIQNSNFICHFDVPKDSNLFEYIKPDNDIELNSKFITIDNYNLFIEKDSSELYIPSEAIYIDELIFKKDFNLKKITVSPDNKYFKDINGKMLVGKSDINNEKYEELYFVTRNIEQITIPSYIKIIKPYSLYRCQIQNIDFEPKSSLTTICEYSFSCSEINSISIPETVEIIEENAFNTRHLKTVNFPKDSKLKYIGKNSFSSSSLTEIIIPKNVEIIEQYAFDCCDYLSKIEFAEGSQLKSIKTCAFGSRNILKLNFPSHLSELNEYWNLSCTKINEVTISPDNDNFKMLEGKILIGKSNFRSKHFDTIYFASRDINTAIIPSYIKYIYSDAFARCRNLQKIEFEENSELEIIGENAFRGSSITEISLPESVKVINNRAFLSSSIQKIVIPSQITHIKTETFYCSQLKQIEFRSNSKLFSIGPLAFGSTRIESILIPSNVRIIESHAFSGCGRLKHILFEENSKLGTIGNSAIDSPLIEKIIIPDNIIDIDNIFTYICTHLHSIEFTENSKLTRINQFSLILENLKNLYIPPRVTKITKDAFANADNLEKITVSPDNKYFKDIDGKMLVGKSNINNEKYEELYFVTRNIEQITIPSYIKIIKPYSLYRCQIQNIDFEPKSSLTTICEYSFSCSEINSISIPKTVEIIEEDAFDNCPNLKNIIFPNNSNLKIIGKYSFAHLPIEKITIPKSVEHIYERAFSDCYDLKVIELVDDCKLQSIGPFVFSNTPISSLHIPSKVNKLKEGWCRFTEKLETVTVSKNNKNFIDLNGQFVLSKSDCNIDNFDILCFASRSIDDTVLIQSNIKIIDSYAFSDCCNINSIIFPEDSKLETIGYESFSFSSIYFVDIPKSTKIIKQNAFMNCNNIHSVSFDENSNVLIQFDAFWKSSLKGFTFPKGINKLKHDPFGNDTKMSSVEFLGNDIIIDYNLNNFFINASLISFPNSKRIKFIHCNKHNGLVIYVIPKAQINFNLI